MCEELIEKGALLNIIVSGLPVWSWIARMGSVELLRYMFDHGIAMNFTTIRGRSVLSFVVQSKEVEAIRYLLDLGVAMTSYTPATYTIACYKCGKNRLFIEEEDHNNEEPFMIACRWNMCNVVQMLDKYDNQNLKTMNALRCAIKSDSVDVVEYLLNKYKYPLNDEYFIKDWSHEIKECYLLKEACGYHPAVVQLLLDHGADPNKKFCYSFGIINLALCRKNTEIIALLIRNGADVSYRSRSRLLKLGDYLPLENAAVYSLKCIAEMLIIYGCSCGLFSLAEDHMFKNRYRTDMNNLMKDWNVCENKVTPLRMQCRRMILKYLSPQAQKKIMKLPLPPLIIKYLGIPELDDIEDRRCICLSIR